MKTDYVMFPLKNGQKVKLYPKYELVSAEQESHCGGCALYEDVLLDHSCEKFNSMDVGGHGCFNGNGLGWFIWKRKQ